MFLGWKFSPKCNPKQSSPVACAASFKIPAKAQQGIKPSDLEKNERSNSQVCRIGSGFPPAAVMASSSPAVAAIEIIGLARTDPSPHFLLSSKSAQLSIDCRPMSRRIVVEALSFHARGKNYGHGN